jgi:hypothetical protein
MNCNWRYKYAKRFVVLVEVFDTFKAGAIATGRRMIHSGNLSFTKRTLAGWMSES